ncbi:ABC transporter permease [Atopobacter phocae]|uniref:ABC transporter permease n=1 Tax=Atopobacter phocae TaxID=136492 RepID=UPI00046FE063|nr:ABC transporter permease [Atopobacter phocae]
MSSLNSKFKSILAPVLSVIFGLLLGAVLMICFGLDAIKGYSALIQGSVGSPFYIGETLRQSAPLIVIALGFAVASSAGFFNIGLSGQAVCGWLASVVVADALGSLPKVIVLPIAILAGMTAGALWAGIAGALKAFFNTSEVIVTIMLNHTAFYASNYIVRNVLTDSRDATDAISQNASLRVDWLSNAFEFSTIHMGIIISLVTAILLHYLMNRTTLGFEIKAVGLNKYAADYAGISSKRIIIVSMLISGALAGLGGVMEGLGTFQNIFVFGSLPTVGFDGLAVSLLGQGNALGIIFSGLLFAMLRIGGNSMPLMARVPNEVVDIVIASIIFFIGINYVIKLLVNMKKNKQVKNSLNKEVE